MSSPKTTAAQLKTVQDNVMVSTQQFPIVGIGASAGGLEALTEFFEHVAPNSGAAYVVVMHLSPVHESHADVILQRATSMPVVSVTKPMHVERDTVYIISPNQILEMNDGYLRVRPREPGAAPVAIDQFMRTLALAHRQHAVAVILSGTGVDGVSSLTLVKDHGGLVLVQP